MVNNVTVRSSGRPALKAVWVSITGLLALATLLIASPVASIFYALSAVLALPFGEKATQRLGLSTRLRRTLIVATAMLGAILFVATVEKPPKGATDRPQTSQVAVAPNATATPAAVDRSVDFLAQYRNVLDIAQPCDASMAAVGEAAQRNSLIDMYSAAKAGQAACQTAFIEIGKFEPADDISDDAEQKWSEAVKACSSAYFLRQRAMETAMKIADGDGRASNVVSFKEDMQAGQGGVLSCVAGWMVAGEALGIKPDRMK